jgi:hypothetical protein
MPTWFKLQSPASKTYTANHIFIVPHTTKQFRVTYMRSKVVNLLPHQLNIQLFIETRNVTRYTRILYMLLRAGILRNCCVPNIQLR